MNLIQELLPLTEESAEAKAIRHMMRGMEKLLPHSCRYKQWDVNDHDKTVEWVTQESEPHESQEAADTIAKKLSDWGFKGWTVKVILRDLYRGNKTTEWKTAVSESVVTEAAGEMLEYMGGDLKKVASVPMGGIIDTFYATEHELTSMFGAPKKGDGKVTREWNLKLPSGIKVKIYDYKEQPKSDTSKHEWHVTSTDDVVRGPKARMMYRELMEIIKLGRDMGMHKPAPVKESSPGNDLTFSATGDHEVEQDSLWVLVMANHSDDGYYDDYYGVNVLFNKGGKIDHSTGDSKADSEWKNHKDEIIAAAKSWAMKHQAKKLKELGF